MNIRIIQIKLEDQAGLLELMDKNNKLTTHKATIDVMKREVAQIITDEIMDDIKSRKGIGDEMEQIDDEIVNIIAEYWTEIILKNANE